MGYRSDIHIKCEISQTLKFTNFLDTYKEEHNIDLRQEETVRHDKNYIYLTLSDWEFYQSYPEVDSIVDFIEGLSDYAGLIEIGEDGETDEWGSPNKVGLYTQTTIEGME